MDQLQTVLQELERGKESAYHIRSLVSKEQGSDGGDELLKGFGDHSKVVITTLDTALSVLRSSDFVEALIKAKSSVGNLPCNSEEAFVGDEVPKNVTTIKDRRGCYKRRRFGQSKTIETFNLTDDGFAWRKYGQKIILNANHPRNYYRCTHKHEQGCQATKQVQQISENPTKHRIIYHGLHTCKTPLKTPPILLENLDNQDSSILLSFETKSSTPKQALNNPFFMFSSSASSSSSSSGFPMKEDYSASQPSDHHFGSHIKCSPPSDHLPPSPDLTTSVSDQGDVISSSCNPHGMDDDHYSYMMSDSFVLDDVFKGFSWEIIA